MGKKNYKGDGVEQNFKESKKWFTLLAEGGNDWSYYGFAYLEYMSYKGIKEDKDIEKALDYLKKAFEPENNEFCIENDFLYSFDKSIIYLYLGEPIKFYEIPDSVKEIGLLSFSVCKKLTSIVIPENVKLKDFYPACDGQDWYEPNALFYDCESLVSAEINANISKIDYKMFSKCINLINVAIPNSVTLIKANAFEDCESLRQIIIPKSVTKIDYCAFIGCWSLDEIVYDGTIKEWNKIKIFDFFESVFEGVPAKVIKCKDGEVEIEQEDDVE